MIGLPAGTQIWLAAGATDMRNYAECSVMLRRPPSRPRIPVWLAERHAA